MKIVRITAIWCSSCLVMKSRWEKVFANNTFEVVDYDYDFDHSEIEKYNVGRIIPVIIALDNNIEVKRLTGEASIKELESFILSLKEEFNEEN